MQHRFVHRSHRRSCSPTGSFKSFVLWRQPILPHPLMAHHFTAGRHEDLDLAWFWCQMCNKRCSTLRANCFILEKSPMSYLGHVLPYIDVPGKRSLVFRSFRQVMHVILNKFHFMKETIYCSQLSYVNYQTTAIYHFFSSDRALLCLNFKSLWDNVQTSFCINTRKMKTSSSIWHHPSWVSSMAN